MAKTLTVYLAADLKKFNGGMDQASRKVNGFTGTLKNNLGPAMIAAGAAAGAFALKLAKDGVQAAIEDEKAVASLANTLGNLNLAHDTSAVEAYIYELERAYGVADTDLRPAYERLVRSTRDTEEANRALKIAMDVAAGTGQSLKTVTDSLGRAFDGQTSTLARLGTGIDKATLATASMDQILDQLSQNFAGSADQAANTFEGRMTRLRTATDNLAEAFGAGLLDSLNDATDGTQGAVDAMEKLEPILRDVGKAIGDNVESVAYLAGLMAELGENVGVVTDNMGPFGSTVNDVLGAITESPLVLLTDAIKDLRQEAEEFVSWGGGDFEEQINITNESVKAANRYYRDAAVRINRLDQETADAADTQNTFNRAASGGSSAVEELTEKQKELLETYELQGIAFATTTDELLAQIQVVQDAARAIDEYANTVQQDLLGGLNFAEAYQQAAEAGGDVGHALTQAIDAQIKGVEWGGNVLLALQQANVEQSLIDHLRANGEQGGYALGQAMLEDKGLLASLNEKWAGVQTTTSDLAMSLVPEFMTAGKDSASEYLDQLLTRFTAEQRSFKKLGRQLGRQVGAEFKARIAKDVADAVRNVEAAAAAARAEAVAAAEARAARETEQAVANALANLIRNADKRSGRDVSPVLQ